MTKLMKFNTKEKRTLLKYIIDFGIDNFVDDAAPTEEDSDEFYTLAYWMIKAYQKGQVDILNKLEDK